jgi:hypothetical protein
MRSRLFRRVGWARIGPSALVAALLGCSSSTTPPSTTATDLACPAAPDSCPTPMPSYTNDVLPIMQTDCIPCHSTNTGGKDESTYVLAAGQESSILFQVNDCLMPPSGSPQLSTDARNTLLGWIECGAPDN